MYLNVRFRGCFLFFLSDSSSCFRPLYSKALISLLLTSILFCFWFYFFLSFLFFKQRAVGDAFQLVSFGAGAKIATRLKISVNKGSTYLWLLLLYPTYTASSCFYCSQLLEVDIFPMQNCLNNKMSYATKKENTALPCAFLCPELLFVMCVVTLKPWINIRLTCGHKHNFMH